MWNLVEALFDPDEQRAAPCVHGNIVEGHACYCHANTPETPRKCHIWRWHGENVKFWRKADEFEEDKGCPYFEPNPEYERRDGKG